MLEEGIKMLNPAGISLFSPVLKKKGKRLRTTNLFGLIALVALALVIAMPALAEDENPPGFAGANQSGAAFWEFSEDSDQPTDYYYLPELTDPLFGFREDYGYFIWVAGGGINGDGSVAVAGEAAVIQPIPEGAGFNITVQVQATYQGDFGDEGFFPELWDASEDWIGDHLGGEGDWNILYENVEDLGNGWTQLTVAGTWANFPQEATHLHFLAFEEGGPGLEFDEVVVDIVIHDGAPPTGPGRPSDRAEIRGEWEDETSDMSRAEETGSNRVLIFTAHTEDDTGTNMNLTSVTYGGQSMTKVIDRNVIDSNMRAYVAAFILDEAGIAAASGNTFDPNWAQTPSHTPAYSSVFVSNVYQIVPIGASDSAANVGQNTIATSSLPTGDGDMVIVAATSGNDGDYQVDHGFTEAVELAPSGADGIAGYKPATGANETPQVTLPGANRQAIIGFVVTSVASAPPDTTPPTPTPMTWAFPPASLGPYSIGMTATTATDPSGVRYYFDEMSGNPGGSDSIWQISTGYTDDDLDPNTQYTYQVKARDKSVNLNETDWSTPPQSATTDPPDTTPPTPDPATWSSEPMADGPFSISMMATEAADESGVQYYFEETSGNEGGSDSGWQQGRGYTNHSLTPQLQYTYRVRTRDQSPAQNTGSWSSFASATTDKAPIAGCPEGDLNNNCEVTMDDLLIFVAQWLDGPGCTGHPDDCADLNKENDGVDSEDFGVLAAGWLEKGATLVINEMMAANDSTIQDEWGDYDDWIEIFNPTGAVLDLGGMYLEDNGANVWQIPAGTSISPGEYKLFWADDEWPEEGDNHISFGLSRNGDGVTLYDTDGVTVIDSKSFNEMTDDISYGRYPDTVDAWYKMSDPTPGSANKIGMTGGVYFSRPSGTFTGSFELGLTTPSPTATIYYTLNGDEPTNTVSSTNFKYTDPNIINSTTWVRARAYDAGILPSAIASKTYIKLATDVQNFESNLPIVIIDSFGWDIDDLGRDFYQVSAAFIDTDEVTGTCTITAPADWAGYGGMHIRGNSTTDYDKKQYRFETWDENSSDPDPKARYRDMDVSLLGFPAESDWILQGPYSDKTLMRNYQMFTWSRQIGRYAVRTKFVEVFLDYDGDGQVEWNSGMDGSDTDYRGVYVFMEKIKRGNDRVDIARLDPSDNAEPEITGGYILKKDWGGDGFMTAIYDDYIMYEDPRYEELTPAQRTWIEDHFNEFETALASGNYNNPAHANYYGNYIDIGSFIDHHILVEFAKNVDGFLLSTFLYKERNGKINMGPIWDYNGSLGGADYICNWNPVGWLYEAHDETCCPDEVCCVQDSCWRYRLSEGGCEGDILPNHYGWYERLFEDPEFLLAYADNWFKHREYDFTNANMLADVDNNVTLLTTNVLGSNAVDRNYTRWDVLEDELWPNYYDNCWAYGATYMHYVNWMRTWISNRLTWMDNTIDDDYGDTPPVIKVNSINKNRGAYITTSDSISMTGNGTIYYTTDGSDPRLHGGTTSGSASAYGSPFTLSGTTQIKARIRYSETPTGWSALNEATFSIGSVAENLRITEIMYHVNDPNHEFVELKNIGGTAINLNLVKFTDGIDFVFPSVSLSAGDYCVVVRNAASFALRYPSFSGTMAGEFVGAINNAGERIELQDALGQTILNFQFKDGWYPITDGDDFSLNIIDPCDSDPNHWEYAEYWQPSSVAGGTPSDNDTGHVASPGDIVINEVMTHTDSPPEDWIELHNTTGSTIDITGWFLSDDDDKFKRYEIGVSAPVTIGPNGYKVFTQNDHFGNYLDPGSDEQFGLSELGETVYLCSGSAGELAGGFCAQEDFDAAENGVSFGRYTKSAAAGYDVDFVSMSSATYEVENTTGAKVGPVVITEIMYHPLNNNYAEYIELKNISGGTVLLDDWKFNDEDEGIEYYIPTGTSLASGEYLLLVKHAKAFEEEFGSVGGVTILEWCEGRLSNAGEKIQISKPGTPEPSGFVPYIRVDRVNYSDGSHHENFHELGFVDPWPTAPDGTGQALDRVTDGNYGNDVANWQAASPSPGS
jgi:hypothetical protein